MFLRQGNELTLRNVRGQDRGVYRCVADNNVRPPDAYDNTINILFKPTARAVQTTYGQAKDRQFEVVIECRIAGTLTTKCSSLPEVTASAFS